MNPDLYIHSTFRFDTLAEAACFMASLAEIDEEHARYVEAHLKDRRVEILLAAPQSRKATAKAIMDRLRELHRSSF